MVATGIFSDICTKGRPATKARAVISSGKVYIIALVAEKIGAIGTDALTTGPGIFKRHMGQLWKAPVKARAMDLLALGQCVIR